MLVWLTLPFYDFCGFRSVAVNSVYKLQFFTFIFIMAYQKRNVFQTRFLPRDAMLARYNVVVVYLSVRLSVRHKPALYQNG